MAETTQIATTEETVDKEIEKSSYSARSYRKLQKMRVRGAEYGKKIPYLRYPLQKDYHTGSGLKVMTIISGIIIAAAVGALLWALITIIFPLISATVGSTGDIAEATNKIPLINLIGAASSVIIWGVAILVPLLAIAAISSVLSYLLQLVRMNHLTMQEVAAGYFFGRTKNSALVIGIIFTIAAVPCFIWLSIWLGLAVSAVAIYAWALFAIFNQERKRAKKLFDQLPTEQQEDFLAHNKAIRAVTRDKEARKVRNRTRTRTTGKWAWLDMFLTLVDGFADAGIIYQNLKDNPEYRAQSTGLGRRAMLQLLTFFLTGVVGMGAVYFISAAFPGLTGFFQILILIVGAIAVGSECLILVPQTLNYSIKQMRLNKKPIGWISLLLTFVAIAAVVGVTILAFSAL